MTDRDPIDVDRLTEALGADDSAAVIEVFRGRTEQERRAVAPHVFQFASDTGYYLRYDNPSGNAACFACGTLSEIKRLRHAHHWGAMCNDVTYRVLVDRRPSWLAAWATWALDREATPSGRAGGMWRLVRELIKAGACDPIDTDAYILGMIYGLGHYAYDLPVDEDARRAYFERRPTISPADHLLADPALLEHEVWRLFDVQGRPSRQLGLFPGMVDDGWIGVLVDLAGRGHLDRRRLLAAALGATARDLTQYQASWFIGLWLALGPTCAERCENQPALLHLLAHRVPAVVQFALRELELVQDDGVLDAASFVEEIDAVLFTMPVVTVKHALAVLDRAVGDRRADRAKAMTAVASTFLHTNSAARAAGVAFLAKHAERPDGALGSIVEANADSLTESQVRRLRACSAAPSKG